SDLMVFIVPKCFYYCNYIASLWNYIEFLPIYFDLLLKSVQVLDKWNKQGQESPLMREWLLFSMKLSPDMKTNARGTIVKICDFLGKKLEPDELDKVLKYSSFQAMKENNMSNYSLVPDDVITNGLVLLRK
ncbi:putative alcohol sulfotransferase isoform X1, partial [Sigmodon hispidus]